MSSYGLIMMVLGVCVSGSTTVVHTGDAGSSPKFIFCSIIFLMHIIISESDKH